MSKTLGTNYRLYTFINFYLSSIQQGIQSAHIVSELFCKYNHKDDEWVSLMQWASKDKTIIVCNGGTSVDIEMNYIKVANLVDNFHEFAIPYVIFQEDPNALGINNCGVPTGFGMILPEQIWDAKKIDWTPIQVNALKFPFAVEYVSNMSGQWSFVASSAETTLINFLKEFSLAR